MTGPLVVIPTFNEASNIGAMVAAVMDALPDAFLLVVDDGSPDETADVVETSAASFSDGRVSVLRRSAKQGLGTACSEARSSAGSVMVVTTRYVAGRL